MFSRAPQDQLVAHVSIPVPWEIASTYDGDDMNLQVIQPATVHDTTAYSYAHAVRMGELIFVSGQVARDKDGSLVGRGDARAQTEQVFKNLKAVLDAAGSGMHKVGKVTVLITKLEYRPIVHEIRSRVFKEAGHFPASTLAVVASLADPDWLVEIEAIALAGSD